MWARRLLGDSLGAAHSSAPSPEQSCGRLLLWLSFQGRSRSRQLGERGGVSVGSRFSAIPGEKDCFPAEQRLDRFSSSPFLILD